MRRGARSGQRAVSLGAHDVGVHLCAEPDMSIFPTTDLVSDVARAANPQKLQGAMQRLVKITQGPNASQTSFAAAMRDAESALGPAKSLSGVARGVALASAAPSPPAPRAISSPSEAAQKFEAFILQSFVESVLPKLGGAAYGHGTAGGVWRSMMAEQLGAHLAKAGGVGIRKMIDANWVRTHKVADPAPNPSSHVGRA
jgi:flagellar protein FlgJ